MAAAHFLLFHRAYLQSHVLLHKIALPGPAGAYLGIFLFFTLIWPYDPTRVLIGTGGADIWFWIVLAQAILFTALAFIAFRRLARTAQASAALHDKSSILDNPGTG